MKRAAKTTQRNPQSKKKGTAQSGRQFGTAVERPLNTKVKQWADTRVNMLIGEGMGVHLLNGLTAGSGENKRENNSFTMKSLYITARFRQRQASDMGPLASAAYQHRQYVRLVVIYDAHSNGGTPTWDNIFTNTDTDGAAIIYAQGGALQQSNMDQRGRFSILADERIALPAAHVLPDGAGVNVQDQYWIESLGGSDATDLQIKRYIKLKGLSTMCQGATSASGDIARGALWLLTYGQYNAGPLIQGDPGPGAGQQIWALDGTARLRFEDS